MGVILFGEGGSPRKEGEERKIIPKIGQEDGKGQDQLLRADTDVQSNRLPWHRLLAARSQTMSSPMGPRVSVSSRGGFCRLLWLARRPHTYHLPRLLRACARKLVGLASRVGQHAGRQAGRRMSVLGLAVFCNRRAFSCPTPGLLLGLCCFSTTAQPGGRQW